MKKQEKNKLFKITLILVIFVLGIIFLKNISSAYYHSSYYGTPIVIAEIDSIKVKVTEAEYIPTELKTKNEQDIEYIKDGRLTRSAYYTIKEINLRIDYYNGILDSVNKTYLILNTAKAFVNQHNLSNEDYIEGNEYFPEPELTQATTIINNMESIIEDQEKGIQITINKINEGLNQIASFDLSDTSNKNLSDIRQTSLDQNKNIIPYFSSSFTTAKNDIKTQFRSLINLAKTALVQP